ncbi:hypothetical protein ACIBI9_26735 [Nonomuraea sp. NPDC050451]|uniref:hypothetical protein n=1 Tax=Nonomuraea sp. NPDC050451 TaxID=3364364 RepID=UPI0037AD2419
MWRVDSLQDPESMRRLPPRLNREIEVFAFAYRAYFPEFLFPAASGEMADLEGELRRLRSVPDELARMEFAIPLAGRQVGGAIPRDPSALDAPEVRRMLADRAAVVADAEMAAAMADDPRAVLERFVVMLETYWQEAFGVVPVPSHGSRDVLGGVTPGRRRS